MRVKPSRPWLRTLSRPRCSRWLIADSTAGCRRRASAKPGSDCCSRSTTGMPEFACEAVNHSINEYVRGQAHTNGMKSFCSMLKRAHNGTFRKMSPKHLRRHVHEFAGKHDIGGSGTLAWMRDTVARLLCRDLVADNGLSSGSGAQRLRRAKQRLRQFLRRSAREVAGRVQYRSHEDNTMHPMALSGFQVCVKLSL